ncbi:ABC transporter ATP-binding protein [Paramicrobacterium fandaimingii]|uniref:ABC transporter ATP-binding protein n=1 Tax=Paramicrobacterium fandaimingii TaxID=2708079 RepID=UPI001421A575|nr:ABC transporter ATP-binding protein [Microbacterium fandaimingii]
MPKTLNGTNTEATVNTKIDCRNVRREFIAGKTVVQALGPLNLQVAQGEFVCLVGPSGCGKSTLLRIIAGLLNPSDGEVRLAHEHVEHPLLSVVFQDYSIYPWKTVKNNVRLGLKISGVSAVEADNRVSYWLDKLHLTRFADSYPGTLSGGMRQRVSIARALVLSPENILMDEPFAALDAQLRKLMQDELLNIWQEDKRTVLFVTHNLDEAILLGDRVVVMGAAPGRVIAEFKVPFERPRNSDLRNDPAFSALEGEIWACLRDEVGTGLQVKTGG